MLIILLRKLINNKWMVLSLLIGSVITVAMVSSVPIYTNGVLQRMLTRDLEAYQTKYGSYPGRYSVRGRLHFYTESKDERVNAYDWFNERIETYPDQLGVSVLVKNKSYIADNLIAEPKIQREEKPKTRFFKFEGINDFENHAKITNGRMYSPEPVDGIIEVVVTDRAFDGLDLRLDEVYEVYDFLNDNELFMEAKVVGVFTMDDPSDLYWFEGIWNFDSSFLMNRDLFDKLFIKSEEPKLTEVRWNYAIDYHNIKIEQISGILDTYDDHLRWYDRYTSVLEARLPMIPILEEYLAREQKLSTTLWVLQVPILLMLAFYMFMVAQLIVKNEENEIAVVKSRGSSGLQIFLSYLAESVILGIIAIILGPPVGLYICKVLGLSNGFLEFVQRTSLPVELSIQAYLYSTIALGLFVISMLLPAYLSSRTSIVLYKQSKVRRRNVAVWKKYFLDFLLLGISGYGIYSYNMRTSIQLLTGASGSDMAIDPLLFLISTMFILGAGLVFIRIFPYIVSFIFWLGRKIWSPALYASFIHVGRSGGQEQFLMLFIILAISLGVFNANSARTINKNIEDKIRYEIGADIAVVPRWETTIPQGGLAEGPGLDIGTVSTSAQASYSEPPFEKYTSLEGAEMVTKVFRRSNVEMRSVAGNSYNIDIMGIIPNEFGKISWMRDGLMPYHWYEYLNILADRPTGFLVSSSIKEKYNLKEGDSIYVTWRGQSFLEGYIFAFIDYWPGYNPNKRNLRGEAQDLIVANYSYINAKMSLEPYETWIKLKPGVTDAALYEELLDKRVEISSISFVRNEIIRAKNDPMLQGTNGALTMGFVITMLISTIGFLIYWILSIKSRALQFGIFRAMGLTMKNIIAMLISEQILISVLSILVGIIIGGVTSDLFIPMLQISYSAEEMSIPFKVFAYGADFMKIYSIIGIMLITGISVLTVIVSRININQAIKLGED